MSRPAPAGLRPAKSRRAGPLDCQAWSLVDAGLGVGEGAGGDAQEVERDTKKTPRLDSCAPSEARRFLPGEEPGY